MSKIIFVLSATICVFIQTQLRYTTSVFTVHGFAVTMRFLSTYLKNCLLTYNVNDDESVGCVRSDTDTNVKHRVTSVILFTYLGEQV